MVTGRVEFNGVDELRGRFSNSRIRVLGALNRGLRRIGQGFTPVLKKYTPRRNGKLANSTRFQVKGSAEDMRLEVRQGARTRGGDFYGVYVREGTRAHEIRPRSPRRALKFTVGGVTIFRARVRHPGTKPNRYHERALDEHSPVIQQIVEDEGINVAAQLAGRG